MKFRFKARGTSGGNKFNCDGTVNAEGAVEALGIADKLVTQMFPGCQITKMDIRELKTREVKP